MMSSPGANASHSPKRTSYRLGAQNNSSLIALRSVIDLMISSLSKVLGNPVVSCCTGSHHGHTLLQPYPSEVHCCDLAESRPHDGQLHYLIFLSTMCDD